jgi:hypothetical protein
MTHPYKSTADRIVNNDPAALLGVDENCVVPALEGEDVDLAVQEARLNVCNGKNVANRNDDKAAVKSVVMDGQVMGPHHCAYDNHTVDLSNA